MATLSAHVGRLTVGMLGLLISAGLGGCRPDASPPALSAPSAVADDSARYAPRAVGRPAPAGDRPWITHVAVVDLDRDGMADIIACDDKLQAVVWLRQTRDGAFEESVLGEGLPSPVHVEAADMDGDGDTDLLVACMGQIFPTNEQIGEIVVLENDGQQHFNLRVLAQGVARVTDVRAGDFDGDGKLDLAVAQFGYDQGQLIWMKNLGNWQFEPHLLLAQSGAINVCVADMDADGTLDLTAVFSQQWEEIHLFENDGKGNFSDKIIFGSTNQDYGSSGISLCDLNRDGKPDVLYTNGDGFDYAEPGARPWHGLQWLENIGGGNFRYHRIGDLPGAYSPVGVDLDGDGFTDVVAVSGFNDWTAPGSVSVMAFRNDGRQNFSPHVLARAPTHLVTCAAINRGSGAAPWLVTGGLHAYPPFDRMGRITLWERRP